MILPQHNDEHNWSSLVTKFQANRNWEGNYRQLLLLGKELSAMPKELKKEEYLINGCESLVWLYRDNRQLYIDSDSRIVRGLILILLSLITETGFEDLASDELETALVQLYLSHHLSASRSNGVNAIWQQLLNYN